jgi:hypothetical protein
MYLSLQLKHSPFSLRFCISSHEIFLTAGRAEFLELELTVVVVLLPHAGFELYLYVSANGLFFEWASSSSLIRASSMVSRSVRGLNFRTSAEMSAFNPPKKVPINAFEAILPPD